MPLGVYVKKNMLNFLKALSKRTKSELNRNTNSFLKATGIIFPIFAYRVIDIFVVALGATLLKMNLDNHGILLDILKNNSKSLTVIIKAMALFCATGFVLPLFVREKPIWFRKSDRAKRYILCIFLGSALALFINIIFSATGFTGSSNAYQEVSRQQHALNIFQGIMIYGLLSPLAEEILFRGIIYNRLRRDYGLWAGLIFSPMLFGIFHGNLVQASYGFIVGLFITWAYERYGAFVYPYIIHACANIVIYTVMQQNSLKTLLMSKEALIVSGLIAFITIYFICVDKAGEL